MRMIFNLCICLLSVAGVIEGPIKITVSDPAMSQPQVLTRSFGDYSFATRKWQGIPTLERARNGRLWAAWYSGGKTEGPDNFVVLVTSSDDGTTWSGQKIAIAPAEGLGEVTREFDPCLWIDPTGRLWLFWSQSFPHWDGRGGVWSISTPHPESASSEWSSPRRLADGIMLNKPIAITPTRWLLPIGTWRHVPLNLNKTSLAASQVPRESIAHEDHEPGGSMLYETTDGLSSVHLLGQAEVPDSWFDENMVVQKKDKSLWMLVRTTYGIGSAISYDDGKNWNSEGDTKLGHVNSRFFIRRLKSGALLLVSNMPEAGTWFPFQGQKPNYSGRSRITARISRDDGKTWSQGLLLDSRDLVAYPDGVQTPDGTIYIIYDHDRLGSGDILLATFTEQDIEAGHVVSKNGRLAHLVNNLETEKSEVK